MNVIKQLKQENNIRKSDDVSHYESISLRLSTSLR